MAESADARPATININVGILGHVDSGKTSLVKALSTHLSTAALDKHPQSQERGITLDLGFSAFVTDIPEHLASSGYSKLQYTLVDCPGHASLIKTIIGGAQIIDMMILVIDIVKGIQTQTAECLVIGEITTDNLVVVLNKVDLLPEAGREKEIEKMSARVRKVLASTKFSDAPFVVLSAAPGGSGKLGAAAHVVTTADSVKAQSANVAPLVETMRHRTRIPTRSPDGPFLFSIDHCFAIKGQGSVLTGTVLSGCCRIGDTLELPELRQEKKVKSMQMFKKAVSVIQEGDRAGICVAGLDPSLVERGLACKPGAVLSLPGAIALVRKIRFFKGHGESESKFHVTVGHSTVMATAVFFGAAELAAQGVTSSVSPLEAAERDLAAAAIVEETTRSASATVAKSLPATSAPAGGAGKSTTSKDVPVPVAAEPLKVSAEAKALESAILRRTASLGIPSLSYPWGSDYAWQSELLGGKRARTADPAGTGAPADTSKPDVVYEWQWAALLFDAPVLCPLSALVIGSHLDSDIHANACRIAFFGRVAEPLSSSDIHELRKLNLYKSKVKVGAVDRVEESGPPTTLIGKNLFKKETDMSQFVGLTIHSKCGQAGLIESGFGKGGKFRATFRDPQVVDIRAARAAQTDDARVSEGFPDVLKAALAGKESTEVKTLRLPEALPIKGGDPLFLRFRKYMYEPKTTKHGGKGGLVQ